MSAKTKQRVCIIGKFCARHEFVHGAEAEELRKKLERFAETSDITGEANWARTILDETDARDSCAWVEVNRAVNEGETDPWAESALATLQAENAELLTDLDRERTQHAGCLTAAEGATSPEHVASRGDYGWSLAYQKTLDLRRKYDALEARATAAEGERDRLRDENARLRGLLPAETLDEFARRVAALQKAAAALAAIPHTEGEASAPPKETE